MFLDPLFFFLNALARMVLLLILDPLNAFCLIFLLLNTFGYVLILMVIERLSRKSRLVESRVDSMKSDEAESASRPPTVSFIIPAHNEEKTIERKLKNTLTLNYPKDRLEVIVIDDGSTDKTPLILKKIQRSWFPELKVIRQSRKGKSSAENKGLQNSKGKIVVISDADVPLDSNSLRFMVEDFNDPKVGGVTCTVKASKENILTLNFDLGLRVRSLENEIDSAFGMAGSFVSFRKSIVSEIDERIFSSDADTGVRIRKRGYKVVYDPRIIAYVDKWVEGKPTSIIGFLKKSKHMFFGSISMFWRHKDMLFRNRYGIFGWVIAPRRIFFNLLSPFLFVLLSINFAIKLVENSLVVPFSLLIALFIAIGFLSRKVAPYSIISKALHMIFMYVMRYYAGFFYYFLFILQRKERRGVWRKYKI